MKDEGAYAASPDSYRVFYAYGQSEVSVVMALLDRYVVSLEGAERGATQFIMTVSWSQAGDDDGAPYEGTLLVTR